MYGWTVPPPKEPTKTREEFAEERHDKIDRLARQGYLRSARIKAAMLHVHREDFIPRMYKDYAYREVPLPIPGEEATISCPHSYPLFYEPIGLDRGHRFLEVGLGSGYGTAIAREIVGPNGIVVSIEIDPLTFAFAKKNLERAGYNDIVLVQGDGALGYHQMAPYCSIAITAACNTIPPALIEQLSIGGKLIAPVKKHGVQYLTLLEKNDDGVRREVICEVLYVSLRGSHEEGKE